MRRFLKSRKSSSRKRVGFKKLLPSLLLGLISLQLLLTGCANLRGKTVELDQPQVPPCPIPDEYVSDELYYISAKYPSTYDFIARLVVHCEAVDILREDY